MNTRQRLRKMLGQSELSDSIINYFLNEDDIKKSMEDLKKYGCKSGMIGTLIYYQDTCEFYNKYKNTINRLASDITENIGYNSIFDFIPELDKRDQFILEQNNQNIMAWFGFEETANRIYDKLFEGREEGKLENKKLKILYKEVGKKPKVMEIDDTLEAKQKLVGGLIEVVPYKDNMLLICNEEGKIFDMPPNLKFENDYIAGDCFVIGDDSKNCGFKSLSIEEIRTARKDLLDRAVQYDDIKENSNDMEVE